MKKSVRIVVQPVISDGSNFSYSSTIFVRAGNHCFIDIDIVEKEFIGEDFLGLWGDITADRKWRFKQMKNIFDSPDVALTHGKQAIVDFFGQEFFEQKVEIILMDQKFVLNSTIQDLPIEYVSEN